MRYDVRSRRNIESIIRFRSTRKYLSSTTYLGLRSVIATVTTFCKQRSTKMTAIDMKFYYNICSRWLVECLILFITNIFRVLTKVNAFAAKYQCVKFCVEMLSYK
ncbi:hypothetical protein GQX74_014412 [Glossina fuscipes]|nr:hypothetical protein GQX74_014412 [Glossina fuscipes]